MDRGLSMRSRSSDEQVRGRLCEAPKNKRGRILDQVVEITGWSRDNAHRRLVAASRSAPGVRVRKPRTPKYS